MAQLALLNRPAYSVPVSATGYLAKEATKTVLILSTAYLSKKADLSKNIGDNFFNRYVRGRTEQERTSKIDKEVFEVLKSKPAKELPDEFDTMPTLIKDWIKHLDENFLDIVLDNMEATTRKEAAISIQNQTKLSPKQNIGVIHSINFHAFKFIGAVRPDASFCKILASLLKQKLPETFDDNDCKKDRKKGEGGKRDLDARIGDSFYNSHVRPRGKKHNRI